MPDSKFICSNCGVNGIPLKRKIQAVPDIFPEGWVQIQITEQQKPIIQKLLCGVCWKPAKEILKA